MSDAFRIKQGDTLPTLDVTLTENGVAVDLSAATSVSFIMKRVTTTVCGVPEYADSGPTISGSATILSALDGQVRYAWGASDTLVAGNYYGEFKATFPTGVKSYPSAGYVPIAIVPDVQ